jgi:glutamate synthase (NADPH/NADH) large chain
MTGGRVVILGSTGRNFAAGMSGGIAYVYDRNNELPDNCNLEMVELETLDMKDEELIFGLITNHFKYTSSEVAKRILDNFEKEKRYFIKVMPKEFRRVLEERALTAAEKEELEV